MDPKRKPLILGAILFLVAVSTVYGYYGKSNSPIYVQAAEAALTSKISYSFGESRCQSVNHPGDLWEIICSPINGNPVLKFSVFPAKQSPYDVPTSFYLVADNQAARECAHDGLLDLLMIDTSSAARQDAINLGKRSAPSGKI